MEVSGELHAPAALPSREKAPGTQEIGGWLDPRAVRKQWLINTQVSGIFEAL